MKEKWEELITLLTTMVNIYASILKLGKQKSAAVIAANMQELEALTQKEQLLLAQVAKLETARGRISGEIAAGYGVDAQNATLAKMRGLAEPAVAEVLGRIADDFQKIFSELLPINKLNSELIEQALSYVGYNINLLTQNSIGPTYASQGQNTDGARTLKILDRKV